MADADLLTRGGIYTEHVQDERLAGAVHLTFIRSHVAHARIAGIDVSAVAEYLDLLARAGAVSFKP